MWQLIRGSLLFISIAAIIKTEAAHKNSTNIWEDKFKLSCVNDTNQEEFNFFYFTKDHDYTNSKNEFIKFWGGKERELLLHFTGYSDVISVEAPYKTFYLARGIHQKSNHIVCFVDYACGSENTIVLLWNYRSAIEKRAHFVIKTLVKFTKKLIEWKLLQSPAKITTSGYCLGGHLAGRYGSELKTSLNNSNGVRMILAFDPPCLGFSSKNPNRVKKTDGKYVEIYHTSKFGMESYNAHTDIIFNNLHQPECEKSTFSMMCSHAQAYNLMLNIMNKTMDFTINGHLIGFYNLYPKPQGKIYLNTGASLEKPSEIIMEQTKKSFGNKLQKLLSMIKRNDMNNATAFDVK